MILDRRQPSRNKRSGRDGPPAPQRNDRLDAHTKRVAAVVLLGLIMSILDMTIVNVALNSLSHDLHTSLNNIQWVVSAYLLALAAVIPLSGWAVKRYGAFRVYMHALVLFTIGSVLCGLATSSAQLITFRAVQGVGGGLLAPTGMTILVNAVGRENLARVMAAMGLPMVLAPVFGPTLGGFLLQSVSWHAIFLINLPIGIVTAIAATRMLPRDRPEEGAAGRLDWPGLVLAALGTIGITYGLSQSASAGSFSSITVVAPLVSGCVLITGFVVRSRRIAHPLLDLQLYRIRAFSAATAVMFCLGAALFATMLLLPLYFQDARGDDALRTGLLMMPQGLGGAIGMNRSAAATNRFGAGLTSLCGSAVLIIATIPFLFVRPGTPYSVLVAAMIVRGFGSAFAAMPAMTAAFSCLHHDQVGDASPQMNVIQRVGGSLGTAVIAVILQTNIAHASAHGGGHATVAAITHAFNQTYLWVIVMTVLACIPGVVLWRVERRLRREGLTGVPAEEPFMEVVA
jgi:EmrB/QacA subfamily drug resistance transporter